MMGPQVHQPPPLATSVPPCLSVLRSPSTGIKNTHRLGASRRLPPGVHFLAWPARVHPPRGVRRGPSRFPARPPPLSLGKLAAARCRGLFLGVEGEGNGKRDRELGRWGREVWERVFLVAISFIKRDPPLLETLPPLASKLLGHDWARANSSFAGPSTLRALGGNKVLRRRR